jgi:hypothetical protein
MEIRKSKFWLWFSKVRTVAAWIVIPAFLSMVIAHEHLNSTYPMPFPWGVERPRGLEMTLMWRNYSLLLAVAVILISVPRWQSLVGLVGMVLFFFLYGSQ